MLIENMSQACLLLINLLFKFSRINIVFLIVSSHLFELFCETNIPLINILIFCNFVKKTD